MIAGTAGHIDHGKTSLVKALTGVDTDRLEEEKRRGITIDLGFAYLPAAGDKVIGFVDVPGHERLVHNMLAGACGIDYVLLVVAANDGPMPQTIEHLQILDLLGLDRGLVALTKADLVDAAARRAALAGVQELLRDSRLHDAEIVPVSSITGEGVSLIRDRLIAAQQSLRPRLAGGRFRLAVDRCFTLKGAGTVVTGTAFAGEVSIGDKVLIQSKGLEARVRSIHAQDRPAGQGCAGQRCALNLTGPSIGREAISRGDWIVDPASHNLTGHADARLRLLNTGGKPLRQWTPVHLHIGASHRMARIVLLQDKALLPGEEGLAQLVFEEPLPLVWGDRFIIRDTSATCTLGGGIILDIRPPRRRRKTPERLAQLGALAEPDAAKAVTALLGGKPGWIDYSNFALDRNLTPREAEALLLQGQVLKLPAGAQTIALSAALWAHLRTEVTRLAAEFHAANPDRPGLPIARLADLLPARLPRLALLSYLKYLAGVGAIVIEKTWVRLPGHSVRLTPDDERLWRRIEPLLGREPFKPPRVRDIAQALRHPEERVRAVLKLQAKLGQLEEVAHDHFFRRPAVAEMARIAAKLAAEQPKGAFSAADFRNELQNGRKVAIHILEFFDRNGITVRLGDMRRVVKRRLELFDEVA